MEYIYIFCIVEDDDEYMDVVEYSGGVEDDDKYMDVVEYVYIDQFVIK